MALPVAELVFTLYGSFPVNPLSRLSAWMIVLLIGAASQPLARLSLAAMSWRARMMLASLLVEFQDGEQLRLAVRLASQRHGR